MRFRGSIDFLKLYTEGELHVRGKESKGKTKSGIVSQRKLISMALEIQLLNQINKLKQKKLHQNLL